MQIGALLTSAELVGPSERSDWGRWIERGRAPHARGGSGFEASSRDDLDQLRAVGVEVVIVTLEWARLEPRSGAHDPVEIEATRSLLGTAHDVGLEVWGCLVDGTLPGWFADDVGGFADESGRRLVWPRHIDWIGETFGDLVGGWVPQREPVRSVLRSHWLGVAPPGRRSQRDTATGVAARLEADGEAWRLLSGTAPVATFQTARSYHPGPEPDARRWARWLDELTTTAWQQALVDGELVVPGLAPRHVPALRDSFDTVIVQMRPPLAVDHAGSVSLADAPLTEAMGEALHRSSDGLGERRIAGAGDLAAVSDDGNAQLDHLDALLEVAASVGPTLWIQTSPFDGWSWEHGHSIQPGIIDRDRRVRDAWRAVRARASSSVSGSGSVGAEAPVHPPTSS